MCQMLDFVRDLDLVSGLRSILSLLTYEHSTTANVPIHPGLIVNNWYLKGTLSILSDILKISNGKCKRRRCTLQRAPRAGEMLIGETPS